MFTSVVFRVVDNGFYYTFCALVFPEYGNCQLESLLRRPDDPDEEVTCDYCSERERNADLHEVAEADLVAFLAEHSDARDVGRSADRRNVAAKRCAYQKTEV